MSEKIKNYLGIAIIVTILVFAYSALQYVSKVERPAMRTFSVSGEGKVVAIPDVAKFTFSVITQGGTDLAKLQKENTEKTNSAIAFVKSKDVDSKDIKTESYDVSPRYQYYNCGVRPLGPSSTEVCPPPEIVGYTVTNIVSVKIRNFEMISDVISGVVDNGANSVSSLSFTIDDPTSIENEARKEAMEQAREKAKAVAKAGNFKLGNIVSVNENYYPQYNYKYQAYGIGGDVSVAESAPTPAIEPGSQEVNININLIYEIR